MATGTMGEGQSEWRKGSLDQQQKEGQDVTRRNRANSCGSKGKVGEVAEAAEGLISRLARCHFEFRLGVRRLSIVAGRVQSVECTLQKSTTSAVVIDQSEQDYASTAWHR